jgi:hypothetical protein
MAGELTVVDATLPADWVKTGFDTSAQVTVENPTDDTVEETLMVTVDGELVATRTVRLDAGERTPVRIEFEAVEGTVAVNGVNAGNLSVGLEPGSSGSGTDGSGDATEGIAGAAGPGFTVQLAVLVLALVAFGARLRRRL